MGLEDLIIIIMGVKSRRYLNYILSLCVLLLSLTLLTQDLSHKHQLLFILFSLNYYIRYKRGIKQSKLFKIKIKELGEQTL